MPFAQTNSMPRIRLFAPLASLTVLILSVTACDKKSPTAASAVPGAGVTIVGTVSAPVPSGLHVTVGGSSNTAQVDGSGQFTLSDVPSGTVDLRFAGSGVNAALVLTNLLANQNVTLVVTLGATSVTLESARRVRGSDEELEGNIESLSPPTTLVVAGRTVSVGSGTSFTASGQAASFGSLIVGQRIAVKGQTGGAALTATVVDILTPVSVGSLNMTGIIANFSGTQSAFQFTANGTQVRGDSVTTLDPSSQFNELGNGLSVQVAGAPRTGYVYATRITITSLSTSFSGKILAKNGTPSQMVLLVANQTVMVSALTDVRRKGNPQGADTIQIGQTVSVTGREMVDRTVLASVLNITADSPGAAFLMSGIISALSGSCPQLQMTVDGYGIDTDAQTVFSTPCNQLTTGDKVEIIGVVRPDFSVIATNIKKI